jgi:hypothetical protein
LTKTKLIVVSGDPGDARPLTPAGNDDETPLSDTLVGPCVWPLFSSLDSDAPPPLAYELGSEIEFAAF